jgi:hypothetical protein
VVLIGLILSRGIGGDFRVKMLESLGARVLEVLVVGVSGGRGMDHGSRITVQFNDSIKWYFL